MSNDVHLAKVSKIHRGIPKANTLGRTKETAEENIEINHDLSPEHPDNNISDNNISSCSTLDIVNLTQQQLETQVKELTKRFQESEKDRSSLERQLKDANAEKDICLRRLDVVSTQHECRITEMHCVIAELSKKLRAKQENIIVEEQEPEPGSEISYQEGSDSELNLTNPDAECQTDPLDSNGEDEVGIIAHQDEYFNMDLNEQDMKLYENSSKGQIEALQEEVLHLKAQIALLQSELANTVQSDKEICKMEKGEIHQPKEFEIDDANESNCSSERLLFVQSGKIPAVIQQHMVNATERRGEMRVPKMAERVKLRCTSNNIFPVNVTSTDLKKENPTTDLMRHLMHQLHQDNSCLGSAVMETVEYDDLRSLQRKVEHLKLQNAVFSLTLDECKEHCEHLYLLCGKYESNAIALQLALNCSDRAIEAYDVMLALLESKLALIKEKSVATDDSRKAVESVAHSLLQRLECEKNICENSLGPWQSTFNIPEKTHKPWTSDDDNRLRYHVSKLKGCRSNVQNTLVSLESPFSDFYEKFRIAALENCSELKNQERFAQLDVEMAIVMQDLLELREENISLKTKIDEMQKERQYNLNRISILEGALNELQLQLNEADAHKMLFQHHRDSTTFGAFENRISYSEAEHSALIEQQLVEALTRESELKGRIQTLIASVAATQKLSENRELDTNLNTQMLEQNKRKYQTRIRKLEQKVFELTMNSGNNVASCSMKQHDVPETTL